MEFSPKDRVIIDRGASNEDEGYVYMASDNFVAITNMDGDKYIVSKERLTKCDSNENVTDSI